MNKISDFFETKKYDELSSTEWESLCDGCGLCCLIKVEDEDSGEIFNTSVCCRLLDVESCRCSDYTNRFTRAPMCTRVTPENLPSLSWLPETCAYRRRLHNQPLPEWHYLVCGDRQAVHAAGVSAKWFAQSEEFIHPQQLLDFVIDDDRS